MNHTTDRPKIRYKISVISPISGFIIDSKYIVANVDFLGSSIIFKDGFKIIAVYPQQYTILESEH